MLRETKIVVPICAVLLALAIPAPANVKNGPARSGIVVRFSLSRFVSATFFDPERELLSAHATNDGRLGCTSPTDFLPLDLQQVDTAVALRQLLQAPELFVYVYDVSGLPPLNCELLTNTSGRLLARGRAPIVSTDNDLLVVGRGANSFGFHSNGWLDDVVGGGTTRFHLNMKGVILPGRDEIDWKKQEIRLLPDPRE